MLAPRGPASRRWWCQGSQSCVEGDLISQTTGDTSTPPTTYTYSRGLLQSSTTGGQTSTYNYDPLGRLDTITGPGGTIEQSNTYDGFDNLASTTQGSGSSAVTTSYSYDPLNRVTSQTTGTSTTSYAYLGLTRQVSSETDPARSEFELDDVDSRYEKLAGSNVQILKPPTPPFRLRRRRGRRARPVRKPGRGGLDIDTKTRKALLRSLR